MSKPNEVEGSLVFDSWVHRSPDLRNADIAENRHLIYEGEGVFLDLLIRQLPDDHSLRVSGQILHGMCETESFQEVSDLPVAMECAGRRVALRTNALGEFSFNSLPDGIWNMTIWFKQRSFVVRELSSRRPRQLPM